MRPAFLLSVLALIALIVAALALGGPGSPADANLLISLQQGALVPAARILTRLGDWWLVLIAGGLGGAWLVAKGLWRRGIALAVLMVLERLAVEQLKILFDRTRPDPQGHLVAVHTLAFPSGHAANAMALGLGLALLLPLERGARGIALAIALLYAFVVGITRLVLGVHWPSDVIGGWAVGALVTLLLVRLCESKSPVRSV